MDKLRYAETVIEQVYSTTLRGSLQWKCNKTTVSANPTARIQLIIMFLDVGPDAAIWEYVIISHPVGEAVTTLANPVAPNGRAHGDLASGRTLQQLNEIFQHVLLKPRENEFLAAMKELNEK